MTVPGTHQRDEFYMDRRDRVVQGRWYVDGKMVKRKLCSFKDAGLDDDGFALVDTPADEERRSRMYWRLYAKAGAKLDEQEARKKKRGASVSNLMADWIGVSRATKEMGTVRGYELMKGQYAKMVWPHPVTSFSQKRLEAFIIRLRALGITNASINNRLNSLRAFFRWAANRGEIDSVPSIKLLPVPRRRAKALTHEQLRAFLALIVQHKKDAHDSRQAWFCRLHMRAALMALGTGMRPGEIWAMPWANLNLNEGWASVLNQPHHRVKEGREKTVSITSSTVAFLNAERKTFPGETWLMDDGAGENAFKSPNNIGHRFGVYFEELGFKGLAKPFHGLRAFYATEALRNGGDLAGLKDQLGHSDFRVTEMYLSGEAELKRIIAGKADSLVARNLDLLGSDFGGSG